MKQLIILLAAIIVVATGCASSPAPVKPIAPSALIGTWKVDLRPKPGAPDYYKEFVVTAVDGKSFTGMFYGTPITHGRINTDWGDLRFAFVTADRSGDYNHSGVLHAGKIEGLSNSLGRNFLAYWSAVKE